MCEAHGSVDNRMEVARSELAIRKEVEAVRIQQKVFGHDLFQELAAALKERDRAVRFAYTVISFVWLWDWDNLGISPGVVAKCGSCVIKGSETGRCGRVAPFEEFISNASKARGGIVGCGSQCIRNLFLRDQGEGARGKGGGVIRVVGEDGGRDGQEEPFYKDSVYLGCGGAKVSRCLEKWGNVVNTSAVAPSSGCP